MLARVGLLLFSILIILSTGCESEHVQECANTAECDADFTCIAGRCQSPDVSLADVDVDDATDPGDCRVDPCADGLICNAVTGVCENCALDEQCEEFAVCHATERVCTCRAGYVRCGGGCVPENSVQSCAGPCQPCPEVEHGEAVCVQQTCSASCEEGFFLCEEGCDGSPGTCVECLDNTHCTDPDAPVCNQGVCGTCASNDDCAGVEGKPICDPASATCVACLLDQARACGDFSCDPETRSCTTTGLRSRGSCEPCRSDAECKTDHICVAMDFDGSPRDAAYCLRIDNAPANETDCLEPFTVLDIRASITTGEFAIVCGINEALTTCEAVLDYDSECADADDCGVPGLNDGVCDTIEFEPGSRCSYPCDTASQYPQCHSPFSCATGTGGTQYCGAW